MTIERFERPPPEKMFKSTRNWLFEKNCSRRIASMPGIGIVASARKRISAPKRKSILFRSTSSFTMKLSFVKKAANMLCGAYGPARLFDTLSCGAGDETTTKQYLFGYFSSTENFNGRQSAMSLFDKASRNKLAGSHCFSFLEGGLDCRKGHHSRCHLNAGEEISPASSPLGELLNDISNRGPDPVPCTCL